MQEPHQGWNYPLTSRLRGLFAGLNPGPVAPPEAAPVAGARPVQEEDEENMDEPPEVKPFMQELAERGWPALEPGLPNDGLPVGGE